MRKEYDEPMYVDVTTSQSKKDAIPIESEIRELCMEQNFAVLATQGDGQPYTSLISFAVTNGLDTLYFSTPRQTRKYQLLQANHLVSIMIDNRSDHPESINSIRGLTITGSARVLEDSEQIDGAINILLSKHPYLEQFLHSSTSCMIEVRNLQYFYVRRFQEVFRWQPENPM